MPRIPRLSRGEQDAPPEANAADEPTQPQDQTQPLTSGDPLATPPPAPAAAEPPSPSGFTSGDPLVGGAPSEAALPPPEAEAPAPEVADAPPPPPDPSLRIEDEASQAPSPVGATASEAPTSVVPPITPQLPGEGVAPESAEAGTPPEPPPPPPDGATVIEEKPADATPRFRERTRMRRRLRELRRLREIAFRDLGGLTFDLHRFSRDRQDLVAEKLQALGQIDAELRELEVALDERRPLIELREPGIAACPRCATLHGTDANFCPGCGTPLRGSVVREAGPLRVTPVDTTPSP